MTELPRSTHGQALWRLLPSVYRERDRESGDLARYLDSMGELLEQIHGTLVQRRADALPYECQPWLLPYFADLLDVHLVSPDTASQRREVAFAIDWRKRKGTLEACVEIAQAMGFRCVVPQEGHLRVARTPLVSAQLPTPTELGETAPSTAEPWKQPGLPAVMVDFRPGRECRARQVSAPTAISRHTYFAEEAPPVEWQQQNSPYGVPVLWAKNSRESLSYQDMSARTVDTRTPTWKHGHHHPKRLLMYAPVPEGFYRQQRALNWKDVLLLDKFDAPPPPEQWKESTEGLYCCRWVVVRPSPDARPLSMLEQRLFVERSGSTRVESVRRFLLPLREDPGGVFKAHLSDWHKTLPPESFLLCVTDEPDTATSLADARRTTISGGAWDAARATIALNPPDAIEEFFDRSVFRAEPGCKLNSVKMFPKSSVHTLRIEHVLVNGRIFVGGFNGVELAYCAAQGVIVAATGAASDKEPRLTVSNSLLGTVYVGTNTCRLEYCTVVARRLPIICGELQASDCIILSQVGQLPKVRIRYSCVPQLPEQSDSRDWRVCPQTRANSTWPLFYRVRQRLHIRGSFVLHPAASDTIRFGAEDGGELGAYHHRQYCLRERALIQKLREFVPAGIEPVLVFDPTWEPPKPPAPANPEKQ